MSATRTKTWAGWAVRVRSRMFNRIEGAWTWLDPHFAPPWRFPGVELHGLEGNVALFRTREDARAAAAEIREQRSDHWRVHAQAVPVWVGVTER